MLSDENISKYQTSIVEDVLDRGWVPSISGEKVFGGAINLDEAHQLTAIIKNSEAQHTLEMGVANGISTLAMVQAVAETGGTHSGIDPCQYSDHSGAAVELLKEFGLSKHFTLYNGPTHLEAPQLLQQNTSYDVIFIDGHHNFDFKFIDFFYADRLLTMGGYLVFHDILLQSTKKVFRFVKSHRNYETIQLDYPPPNIIKRLKYIVGALVKGRSYWYWWPGNFRNLLVLRKVADSNHAWDYYKNF